MDSPVSATAARWVLLCALVFGLVGMHSLVIVADAHSGHGRSLEHRSMAAGAMANGHAEHTVDPDCCAGPEPLPAMGSAGWSGHGHDMRHLCLAVLVALAGILIAGMWWRRRVAAGIARAWKPSVWAAGRSPPSKGTRDELLSRLCVLRL